jgi:S1-C subfamily serine protease
LKVASVAKEVIEYLANREEPMTNTLKPSIHVESASKKTRKGVVPGAPAESSGLREGDVIVRIGSNAVHNLRDLSNVLKSLNPGDRISITFLREGKEMTVETEVVER